MRIGKSKRHNDSYLSGGCLDAAIEAREAKAIKEANNKKTVGNDESQATKEAVLEIIE